MHYLQVSALFSDINRVQSQGRDPAVKLNALQRKSDSNSSNGSCCDGELMVTGSYWEHGSDSETVLSDVSSVPEMLAHPSINESWLMTPPPIFTLGGNAQPSPVDPFENMLIEHPSMSVYQSRGKPSSTGHDSDSSDGEDEDYLPVDDTEYERVPAGQKRKAVEQTTAGGHSRAAISAKQQLIAAKKANKAMQAAKKKRDSRQLTSAQLHRNNKIAQKRSNKPIRRKDQMHRRQNGAVNDRKSQ